jgi:hypothetical protein
MQGVVQTFERLVTCFMVINRGDAVLYLTDRTRVRYKKGQFFSLISFLCLETDGVFL